MPKWKGKKVSRKRYYDLMMCKEFREFLKEKQTIYVPREAYDFYARGTVTGRVSV